MANMNQWERRPDKGWYRAPGHVKTHYWDGIATLCGRTWHGWKWRKGSYDKCQKCIGADMDAWQKARENRENLSLHRRGIPKRGWLRSGGIGPYDGESIRAFLRLVEPEQ
jgi:hypothetical protein